MKACSHDLWQRVLRAVDQGHTQAEMAKMFAISCVALLITFFLVGTVSPIDTPARAATGGCVWQMVKSPSPGLYGNSLGGVAAISHADAWAVGTSDIQRTPEPFLISIAIVQHWDGTRWGVIPSPQPANYRNGLSGVAALSSSNVWAVGEYVNGNSGARTLIEHWNGQQWNMVPSPNERFWFLIGIAALDAHDLWAVGSTTGNTLIMHYC